MQPSSISNLNRLPANERREVFQRLIPAELKQQFGLNPYLVDTQGNDLLLLEPGPAGDSIELSLFHEHNFADPILYGHLSDTLNGQIHILLYTMNDPASPRFDVDRLPDGTSTRFGTSHRNIPAELNALQAGLLPGQIRRGLHLLREAHLAFEEFVRSLGHTIFFVEPLYYHNAIIFERYGFAYQRGRRRMENIHNRFSSSGDLSDLLGSNPFRSPDADNSIRLRSWAIHDGILDEPFSEVTMYKTVGKSAGIQTAPDTHW